MCIKPARLRFLPMLSGLLALFFLFGCGAGSNQTVTGETPTPPPLQMQWYKNPAAFDMLFPDTWTYFIPSQGLVVFINNEAGRGGEAEHSLTVLRIPISEVRGDLNERLQHYLDSGPLAAGFEIEVATLKTTLDGRPALETLLTSEDPPQTAYVAAAETKNGHVYIFTGVTPRADWEAVSDQFVVMVHSVVFNE